MKVIVTGGAGFIGSTLVGELLSSNLSITELLIIDNLSYAGSTRNLDEHLSHPMVNFQISDICDRSKMNQLLSGASHVFNLAAESHVDRSINDSAPFWRTNLIGTVSLLEAVRENSNLRFLHVSTDEVYGSIDQGSFSESDRLNPSSPYSASKAASDLACLSYSTTYGINTLVTRSANNFGPHQFPEKLIPVLVNQALRDEPLTLYGTGQNKREWISSQMHSKYLIKLMFESKANGVVNIGTGHELSNLEMAQLIISTLDSKSEIKFIEDRLGHDWRYSVNTDKLATLVSKIDSDVHQDLQNCIIKTASQLSKLN
jgi:dTDP-glucose 4,6-dehydratase